MHYFKSSLITISHGFFSRLGGISQGLFSSLNFSPQDNPSYVEHNKKIVCETLGFESLVTMHQIHSGKEIVVDDSKGSFEGDALITQKRGILLGIKTADCVPILLHDPVTHAIAAIHCGWRGALCENIIKNTINSMKGLGVTPSNIHSAIGPCIRHYEVGDDVVCHLSFDSPFVKPHKTKYLLNLSGLAQSLLKDEGIQEIDDLGYDTLFNEPLFFSCRRAFLKQENGFGVQISVIGMK